MASEATNHLVGGHPRDGSSCGGADEGCPLPSIDELKAMRETMGAVRWRQVSDEAQVVAHYLRCHPRVEAVRYPGLKGDPMFGVAARELIAGFGPVVAYRVAGEWRTLVCEQSEPRTTIVELEKALGHTSGRQHV